MRFTVAFDLAKRLLAGIGHDFASGSADTFVFLLDMNDLFEKYCHAVLESHFAVAVEEQKPVGKLLAVHPGGIRQLADFYWGDEEIWIGDAKYKHLARGHIQSLRFQELFEQSDESSAAPELAGRIISAADVRQLTVYASLAKAKFGATRMPTLMLLYPFVGPVAECVADKTMTWNGSTFWLMPVQVKAQTSVAQAIRFPADMTATMAG